MNSSTTDSSYAGHWNATNSAYAHAPASYASAPYHSSGRASVSYEHYPPQSTSAAHQGYYGSTSPTHTPHPSYSTLQGASTAHSPRISSRSNRHSYSPTQAYSQSYTQGHSPSSQGYPSSVHQHPTSRSRSHSQSHPYMPSTSPVSSHAQSGGQYPGTTYPNYVPIPPSGYMPTNYSTNENRPYACEMCSLSFSRQHDLKRHRDTHSGEKPYECNGGCGKTFTRKDALKRHQIVKNCGSPEEQQNWP